MRFPGTKRNIDLEPRTGEKVKESNWLERKLKLGSIGTIFASGSALFSDGYANAAIGPAQYILSHYIYPELKGSTKLSLINSMGFAGTILGQLSFGFISDKVGRKFSMLLCTAIVFVFSALSAAAKGVDGANGVVNALIAYRFLLGIGIGGEYPAGSVAAAENTEDPGIKKKSQQRLFVLATNTMLDFAFAIAYFVCLVWIWILGTSTERLNAVWRITLGAGIIPPLFLFYFRLKMSEPENYKKNSMKHASIPYWLIIKRYWVRLLAVSVTWFIYDWITYPFGIYSTTITDIADTQGTIYTILGWGCLINAFYIPGTLVGAFIVDYLGPKYCMIFGLVMQAIFGFALSGAYNMLVPNHIAGFAIMYGIFLSFGEVGPGNNLGLLASKAIGPTAVRGQLYGIAAAVGKVGAFIGTYTFPNIIASFTSYSDYAGETGVFYVGSGLALISALITLIFIPNIKADAMHDEDIRFREYLEQNGYDTSQMGLHDTVDDVEAAEIAGVSPADIKANNANGVNDDSTQTRFVEGK